MKAEQVPHEMPAFSLQVNIFPFPNIKQNNKNNHWKMALYTMSMVIIKIAGNKCWWKRGAAGKTSYIVNSVFPKW